MGDDRSEELSVSVIVASPSPGVPLSPCLSAIELQRDLVDVIVCEATASPAAVRERFAWARFVERPGSLVPELWRDGIALAGGDVVALTISPMVPAADWLEVIRREHRRFDVVAGAIEPGGHLRASDWAEYFCRFARDMLPFEGHECVEHLPGDNSSYKRSLLERTRELYDDGFWEPVVNRRLAEDGIAPWHTPEMVVRLGRSFGPRAFARQRLVHGRAHGRKRGARFSQGRNLLGAAAAPLVPPLLTLRVLGEVRARHHLRLRAAWVLPLVLAFDMAWAAGEALGHVDCLRGR